MARGAAVGILTRAPQPGRSKTRLASVIGDDRAAALAAAMLQDTVGAVATGAWRTVLFVEPAEALEEVRALCGQAELWPQAPGDIGARMRAAAEALLRDGCTPVVLVGSDIPGLGAAQIEAALTALIDAKADAVFGPASDGGYYLVGLRRMRSEREAILFGPQNAWSTGAVLAQSEAAAEAAGLRVGLVEALSDIDTAADLARLRTRIRTASASERARLAGPRTRALLASLTASSPDTGDAERSD